MEAELEQRVQQFRSLSENIPGVIFEYEFRKDGSDGYRYISPAMEKLFGIPPADFYTFFRYIHPDDKAEIERIRSQSRNTLAPFYIESRLVIPGKGTYWLSISSSFSYYSTKGTKVFTGIMIDITAQKNLEKDLIKAREQAEQFAKSKDNFLANMSHEIRTPMNAVLGMAGQLAKTNLDDKQRFYLETIYSASENLLVILNDILDLTKIKAGKLGLERLGFRPSEVFARALQVMMHKAEEKGLLLRIGFCDPQLSDVLIGDPYRLNQVLLNLLSNAIKFTAVGSVDLSCRVLEDTGTAQQIGIDVADTGMGMDDSFIENLFEKFTQEYDSVTRKFGGTGLGMSICKELITLMGGDIQVTSKKGVGTTIHLIITLEKGGESDLLSRDNTPVDTDSLKNKKVLVVDDNDMNRLVATTMLENYGTVLFEAANGQEAIDFLRDQSVDIVLMDIQMPVMSGLEASRVIREEISPTLPIIALTANAIRGEKDKCMAAGMNGYLSKPFEESALIKMITGSIPRQEANTLSASPDPALGAVPQAGPLYDLHRIEAIGQGKEAFTNKMIRLFIDQVPAILQELQAAGAKADFQTIHEKAHLLKPILHNFAIDSLYEPIRELDDIALAHTPSARIDALVQTISTVAGEVVAILRQGLNS
jgi:PAS domain S-box-containing protein